MKQHIINAKELRASLPEIVRAVRQGDRFTVLYRSRPAFQIIGAEDNHNMECLLKEDPLFQAGAVGTSSDGFTGTDHDAILYGPDKA